MSFIQFARAHGIDIDPAKLYPGEKIKRCGTTEKPRSGAGAYFWDGERGWVFDWSGEARVHWFNDPSTTAWTQAEKDTWRAKRQAASVDQEESYRRAAARAHELLASATPGQHSYLHSKGFPEAEGFTVADGALLIPMRAVHDNALQGVQVIRWLEDERRHEKKMQPGMKAKAAVFRMGAPAAAETCLVEGYADGLSVQAALRSIGITAAVVVCFSAHNIATVAPLLTGRRWVFADNDTSGTGQRVAEQTGLPWCMSDVVGNDANDDFVQFGSLSIVKKIMEVRRKCKP